jgi:hypothetical protein
MLLLPLPDVFFCYGLGLLIQFTRLFVAIIIHHHHHHHHHHHLTSITTRHTCDNDDTSTGGDEKYSGESAGEFPGSGGRPPLVIPSDTFVLHFHSKQQLTSNSSSSHYGYKVTVMAPVNPAVVKHVMATQAAGSSSSSSSSKAVVERAVAEALNDPTKALALLQSPAFQQQCAQAADSDAAGGNAAVEQQQRHAPGLFRDPLNTINVNLQTGEIFLHSVRPSSSSSSSRGIASLSSSSSDYFHRRRFAGSITSLLLGCFLLFCALTVSVVSSNP